MFTLYSDAKCVINVCASGLGKSLIDITIFVMQNNLTLIWEKIDKDRRIHGTQYLPECDLDVFDRDLVCPS
jgi:hypothetical protein